MYMMLGLHQIVDSFLIREKCEVHMNNWIKSVDQFGVADTFVLDQFAFVKKNVLQVRSIEFNQEEIQGIFDQQPLLAIVEASVELANRFPNQWFSLTHYYHTKYGHHVSKKKINFVIKQEKIDLSGSIQIFVNFLQPRSRFFLVRFNEKVIFSVLESMALEKQLLFSEKIRQGKDNGDLMLMVEAVQVMNGNESLDVSALMYQEQFRFLSLIKLRFQPHSRAVDFLRYLKNRYKIVIMTSSTFEYFDSILVSATGLKCNRDKIVLFEECEEKQFEKQLIQKRDQYKKSLFKSDDHLVNNRGNKYIRKRSFISENDSHGASSEKSFQNFRKTIGGRVQQKQPDKPGNLIVGIDSSLIVYLSRPRIQLLIKQLSQFSTYIICYNSTQFQKQLFSSSILKIFAQHIYISNHIIDSNIFRLSNLSVCLSNNSACRHTTAVANSYKSLQQFISRQCMISTQLTTIIIKTHIFKNQCLIWGIIVANLVVFQGHFSYIDFQYSLYLLYFFNITFTILPILYDLVARPDLLGDILVEDYKDYKLRYQHFKAIFSALITTLMTYVLLPEADQNMVFFAVLVNSILLGNFYHLVIDDSSSKKKQIIIIILQSAASIGGLFLTIYIDEAYQIFNAKMAISPFSGNYVMFFVTVFVAIPFLIFIILFFMSFHKSINTKDSRLEKKKLEQQAMKSAIKKCKITGKVAKSTGKQMRFRKNDTWVE